MKRFICIFLFISAGTFAQEEVDAVYGASVYSDQLFPFSRQVDLTQVYSQRTAGGGGRRPAVRPPLHTGRIVLESVVGLGGGFLTAIAGAYIGDLIAPADCYGDLFCISGGAMVGILVGYPLGTALGVYAVGNIGNETGSFTSTLAGSVAGFFLGLVLTGDSDSAFPFFVCSVAGPVVAFNMSRRYKDGYSTGSNTGTYRHGRVWDHQTPLITDGGIGVNILSIGL